MIQQVVLQAAGDEFSRAIFVSGRFFFYRSELTPAQKILYLDD